MALISVLLCGLQLVSVLREVKYLEARQAEVVPDTAADIYSRKELLWQYVANLELTAGWYNKVTRTVLEVEFPLVRGQLREIDVQLREAEESMNWNRKGGEWRACVCVSVCVSVSVFLCVMCLNIRIFCLCVYVFVCDC